MHFDRTPGQKRGFTPEINLVYDHDKINFLLLTRCLTWHVANCRMSEGVEWVIVTVYGFRNTLIMFV